MDVLLYVLDCFCKEILITWLKLVDIAKLDTAFCNHKCRPVFLQGLANESAVYEVCPIHPRHSARIELFTQWIVSREIFVKELFTDTSFVLGTKYIQYVGQELRKLSLAHDLDHDSVSLAIALANIAQYCTKFEELRLLSEDELGCEHFAALSRLHNLQHLHISGATILNPNDLQQAIPHWPDLRIFEAALCDLLDADIVQLAVSCSKLQRLQVARCELLTDTALCAAATHCHQLTELDIQGTGITDVGVLEIALHCAHLRVLLAGECTEVSDYSIVLLSQRCSQLHTLDVRQSYISDASLHSLAEHSPQLRYLDISECADVSNEGIAALATRCTQLESLCLSADQVAPQTLQLLGDRAVMTNHYSHGHGIWGTGVLGIDADGGEYDYNSDYGGLNGDY